MRSDGTIEPVDIFLYPPQQDILDHGMLDLGFSLALSLPTGAGKTTLAEMAFDRAIARGERCVYLTPLKALAEEKIHSWAGRWPSHRIGIYTGDYLSGDLPVSYADAHILIMTYERFDALMRGWSRHAWIADLGCVVVDEFHMLGDPSRGPRLEGALSRFMRINPFARIIALSATMPNHQEVARWLGGVSYHSSWRPVPLTHSVERWKKTVEKPDLIARLVAATQREGGQCLIFAGSRRRAESLAKFLGDQGILATHHHAGLTMDRRREVEQAFRSGDLAAVVCTPTLEMGVNLPCRRVIMADATRWNGEQFAPITVQSYLQRAGRAGRPGQDAAGEAVLLAPSWAKKLPDYGRRPPEPVLSQMGRGSALAEQILVEVASRCSRTRAQLEGSFAPSALAGIQDPSFPSRVVAHLDTLLGGKLMEEDLETGFLRPTRAGWIAVRHQLTPDQALHLLDVAEHIDAEDLADFDVLFRLALTPGLQPSLRLSVEAAEVLEDCLKDVPSYLLDAPPPATVPPRHIASAVLLASLLSRRMEGCLDDTLCASLDVYGHDVVMAAESLARFAEAGADLADASLSPEDLADLEAHRDLVGVGAAIRLRRLGRQAALGINADAVGLTQLPGCGGVLTERLIAHGFTNLEDIALADRDDLLAVPGVGHGRAGAWITAAEDLVQSWSTWESPRPAPKLRSPPLPTSWPEGIEPGRLVRSQGLRVEPQRNGAYVVSGGAEEHLVTGDVCDCADFTSHGPGWMCKHRMAVRRFIDPQHFSEADALVGDIEMPATMAGHLAHLALGNRLK